MSVNETGYQEALTHHQLDEDRRAIDILTDDGFSEDAKAMHLLGQIYFLADKRVTGVGRNPAKARKFWLRALELGSADAAYDLGKMYRSGDGVKQSDRNAERYWLIATENGHDLAAFDLVQLYYDDLNDKIDKAIELCMWLISKGEFVENCSLILGRVYYRGLGTTVDLEKAFYWLDKGAALGHGNSCMDLAMMYYKGEFVDRDLERAIELVGQAGKTEWLREEAPIMAAQMRNGTL